MIVGCFMANPEMKELILFLFDEINEAGYHGATEYKLLKLLYTLERELPEEHPLKYSVPFYWYLHGPFSDPVRSELKALDNQFLTKGLHNNYNLFKIKSEVEYEYDLIDEDIRSIVSKLMVNKIFFNIEKIVYQEFSPYEFMPLYKFNFLETINQYSDSIKDGDEDPDLINEAVEICYDCETKLPFDKYFIEYEDLFSNFLTSLDRLNREEKSSIYHKELKNEAELTWKTFGYGVGVKHHHPHYESKLSAWDRRYKDQLKNLNSEIKSFSRLVRQNLKPKEIKFSDTSKRILSSTVGTYLTCDTNEKVQ